MTEEEKKAQAKKFREMLEGAVKQVNEQIEINKQFESKCADLAKQVESLKTSDKEEGVKSQEIEDALEKMADLQSKMKAPTLSLQVNQKDAIRDLALKSINSFVGKAKSINGKSAHGFTSLGDFIAGALVEETKTLALDDGNGSAATAVQEVMAMDLIEYGREMSPILSQIGMRSGLTRDYRELVLSKYPTVADGVEAVPGTNFPTTGTQEYGQVKSDTIKIMSNAPITDEAFFGTTYNVYSDLIRLLGDQFGVALSTKVLYGDGTDKNGRGILSSDRLDITDGTGKSWLPSMATDTVAARDHEYFPAFSTGVAGKLGTDDAAIIQLVLDVTRKLPQKYRGNAKWHMTESTYAVFEAVTDTTGRPLLTKSYIDSAEERLRGKPVVFDETLPELADGAPVAIYGDLSKAFAMANGDIDYMQINTMKTQGVRYVEHNKEMFTIMQASDGIIIVVATANAGA